MDSMEQRTLKQILGGLLPGYEAFPKQLQRLVNGGKGVLGDSREL